METHLQVGDRDGRVLLWDTKTQERIRVIRAPTYWVDCITFSPDGMMLSFGSDDLVNVYDLKLEETIKTFNGHTNLVNSLVYSPDGKILVSSSRDGSILFWDLSKLVDDR